MEPASTHVLPLEDDIEVSPLYYWWLRRAADAYGPFNSPGGMRPTWSRDAAAGANRFVGISLYSPRLDEIHYPLRNWRTRLSVPRRRANAPVQCPTCVLPFASKGVH